MTQQLLTIETGVLQEVWMDGDFALTVGIIRDPASALVRKVILIRGPLSGVGFWIFQLPLWEHGDITMKHASERDVDIAWLVKIRNGVCTIRVLCRHLILTIAERVGWLGRLGDLREARIGDCRASWRRRTVVPLMDDC